MNEHERKEFEHHKKMAEEQLSKMYYGTNKKSQNNGGISFPSFLSSPNLSNNNKKSESTHNSNQSSKNQSFKTEVPQRKTVTSKSDFKNSNNILNFLNFKGMKMDNDRLIILAVCLLLSGENIDELLMLALIYIML